VNAIVDAFWRAALYCLHPRVIAVSLLPLLLAGGALALLGWWYWEAAVAAVRSSLEQRELIVSLLDWLDSRGATQLRTLVAPMIVVALAVPLVVLLSLLLVASLMTPAIVGLVAARRFPDLQRKHGAGWLQCLLWALVCSAAALLALVVSIPLWFVPPLILVLPPLIWGWLAHRVLGFDALAAHATPVERRVLLHRHRLPLLFMGLACGVMGTLPSLIWGLSAATLIFAPLLVLLSLWLYMLVFAFAAAWFVHFLLAALHRLRQEEAVLEARTGRHAAGPAPTEAHPPALSGPHEVLVGADTTQAGAATAPPADLAGSLAGTPPPQPSAPPPSPLPPPPPARLSPAVPPPAPDDTPPSPGATAAPRA
jgi:hypothetical protein